MLSRNLEQTLHRALAEANARHHEYAMLEHLLLAMTEDQDAVAVLKACSVDLVKLRKDLSDYIDTELTDLDQRCGRGSEADRRLPACVATRGDPRPILGPRAGDRRQHAGGAVLRA